MRGDDQKELAGVRVIVVEDEALLRLELSDILEECGAHVVGTAAHVGSALPLVEGCEFDIALLDVNLGGEEINPVVAAVERRGAPFLFLTGYGSTALRGLPPVLVVEKPYDRRRLVEAIVRTLEKDQ